MADGPTPIDYAFQIAYRVAHRMLRFYWGLRRPRKGGTLVAVWNGGEILIVKNTYRKEHTLPGGYPHSGETPAQTGARELTEECGVKLPPERFREALRAEYLFEGRIDDVTIVEVELAERVSINVDHREVAYARFMPPSEVLLLAIVPHLRDYLKARVGSSAAAPASAP
jgi:8-oxo-dGTP pyrophosphatase MutT (NUDIX family)